MVGKILELIVYDNLLEGDVKTRVYAINDNKIEEMKVLQTVKNNNSHMIQLIIDKPIEIREIMICADRETEEYCYKTKTIPVVLDKGDDFKIKLSITIE